MWRAILLLCFLSSYLAVGSTRAQTQNEDETCYEALAPFVKDAGLPLEETVEIFGCRQLRTGEWVEETVGDTREFLRYVVPPAKVKQAVIDAREQFLVDLNAMLQDRRFSQWLLYDIPTMRLEYVSVGGSKVTSTKGETLWGAPDGLNSGLKQHYDEALVSFLLDPNNQVIASYVAWFINRRDSAVMAFTVGMNPYYEQSLKNRYHFDTLPWPWALADPYAIDSFWVFVAEQTEP